MGFLAEGLYGLAVFLAIARDPVGLRQLMPLCVLEKLSLFAVALSLL